MKKVLTIIGARPQFIKASVVSKAFLDCDSIKETILHTGQHFDPNMSDVFFEELQIPRPSIQLNVNGGTHGEMTGKMLIEIERAMLAEKPDRVLVYGDTNSTLAGALAASKLHIPVAHVEAGLRSFNTRMPEEINRVLTDQLSDILFCPTNQSVENLKNEGFERKPAKFLKVGDVMQDSALFFAQKSRLPKEKPEGDFILATMHRAENTDDPTRMEQIVSALNHINKNISPVLMPVHPRTKKIMQSTKVGIDFKLIDPVGYFEMLGLLKETSLVLTDSGGLQKEAYFFQKPCLTLRDETEWVELIECGANKLVGADRGLIIDSAQQFMSKEIHDDGSLYGGGEASKRIVEYLSRIS